jgi:hypothetical protein
MKTGLITALLTLIFAAISCLFWHDDWVYRLPTPVPSDYQAVAPGTHLDLTGRLPLATDKPVFIHFFNPRCPCSKFNIPQFRSLVRTYGGQVRFATVVMDPDSSYTREDIRDKLGVDIPVSFDRSIATACGVYSTPQAVLLDAGGTLQYRGNYNKSRYCADKATNYAEQAIAALLNGGPGPGADLAATTSYGCQLPNCTK